MQPNAPPAGQLRIVVIGGTAEASALVAAIKAAGLEELILVVATAGRVTPALMARAAGEAFVAWAHRLGASDLAWIDLGAGMGRVVSQLEARLAGKAREVAFRMWIERVDGTELRGRLVCGTPQGLRDVVVMPSAQPAAVTSAASAEAGGTLVVTLDRAVDAAPGGLLSAASSRPELADQVAAHVVWAGERPLLPGRPYQIRLGPQVATAQVGALKHKLNPADLDPNAARQLGTAEVGLCNLSFSAPLLFEPFAREPALGRFTLTDPVDGAVVGFGRIAFTLRRATNIHWQALSVDKGARAALKGQRPCCLWLTGLSGSGKSTVASLLEKRLNAAGRHTYTLDGDNVRHGLNRDLGFTDADRVENIRRVGEVARLFVDAGLIVIVSFISPFRAERRMARELMGEGEFLEVFVDTPIEICEARDPKGLYRKARAGGLKNFTGIDSPYEPPERADIRLKGAEAAPEALVDQLYRELERRGMI